MVFSGGSVSKDKIVKIQNHPYSSYRFLIILCTKRGFFSIVVSSSLESEKSSDVSEITMTFSFPKHEDDEELVTEDEVDDAALSESLSAADRFSIMLVMAFESRSNLGFDGKSVTGADRQGLYTGSFVTWSLCL